MSSIGFSDVMSSRDWLAEKGLRPWWETLRGNAWAVMFATSLFMVYYVTPQNSYHCTVCLEKGTVNDFTECNSTASLSEAELAFATDVCASTNSSHLVYSSMGVISVGLCMAAFFLYNCWLLHPTVVNGFTVVKEVNDELAALKLPASKIKRAATSVMEEDIDGIEEPQRLIIKACFENLSLCSGDSKRRIIFHYVGRSIIVISFLSCIVIAVICFLAFATYGVTIVCSCKEMSWTGVETFLCYYGFAGGFIPCVYLYLLSTLFQVGFAATGLLMVCKQKEKLFWEGAGFSAEFIAAKRDNEAIKFFSDNHFQGLDSSVIQLMSIPPDELLEKMNRSLNEHSNSKDDDFRALINRIRRNIADQAPAL